MHGIQHYDGEARELHLICPVCEHESAFDMSKRAPTKPDPTDRRTWTLCIGVCPGCGSEHYLHCALPDGHPHADHVNRLLEPHLKSDDKL